MALFNFFSFFFFLLQFFVIPLSFLYLLIHVLVVLLPYSETEQAMDTTENPPKEGEAAVEKVRRPVSFFSHMHFSKRNQNHKLYLYK